MKTLIVYDGNSRNVFLSSNLSQNSLKKNVRNEVKWYRVKHIRPLSEELKNFIGEVHDYGEGKWFRELETLFLFFFSYLDERVWVEEAIGRKR